jgi:hypothetical protein
MWVGDHPDDPGKGLVLLDTEGLNDVRKGDRSHDAKIFTLAILLSSIFVYNSKGAIDASALEGLHVASQLSKHIKTQQNNLSDFAEFFPEFIWALRDFHLELQDNDGRPITEKQYLERSLVVDPNAAASREYTPVKQAIRDYFPTRDCFTFVPPVGFKHLKDLESKRESELDPDFLESGEAFKKHIMQSRSLVQLKGETLTGNGFTTLASQYVKLINNGSINLQSAHDYMIKSENSAAIKKSIASFESHVKGIVYPMSTDDFFNVIKSQRDKHFEEFRARAINLSDHMTYVDEFDDQFRTIVLKLQQKNEDASTKLCQDQLQKLSANIDGKQKEGQYYAPGGYFKLKEDVDALEEKYMALEKKMAMGPAFKEAKEEFWNKKVP